MAGVYEGKALWDAASGKNPFDALVAKKEAKEKKKMIAQLANTDYWRNEDDGSV